MVRRIALIYDDTPRPDTTGVYCLRALKSLVNQGRLECVDHILPANLHGLNQDNYDFYLRIDDGLDYKVPLSLFPRGIWLIDTHLDANWAVDQAVDCDVVCTAQQDGTELLRQHGIDQAQWLPVACDPLIHGGSSTIKKYDFSFIGHTNTRERKRLLELLCHRFPNHFVGQKDYREMGDVYASSRIVFNKSVKNDINMRVFEALASGSLLLTNDLSDNGLPVLFQDGVHLATYRSAEDLIDKMDWYLSHEPIREQITARGQHEALQQHTYEKRMRNLLDFANSILGQWAPSANLTPPFTSLSNENLQSGQGQAHHPGGPTDEAPLIDQDCKTFKLDSSTNHLQREILPSPPNRTQSKAKSTDYYSHARREILDLVPLEAKRILDIGCGSARLGELIKQRQTAHVTGIEINSEPARLAAQRIDRVLQTDIDQEEIGFADHEFDCVICADILEHLREPQILLKQIRRWLTPNGTLITSIPNTQHFSIIRSLLAGNWTYEKSGLLDQDHVRFFTRREIEKLLFRSGLKIVHTDAVIMTDGLSPESMADSLQVQVGPLQIQCQSQEQLQEFVTYQWLMVCVPDQRPSWPLTSIIIPTYNQLRYTRLCLDSIRVRTDEPYELIVVDNGSTDGTVDFLQAQNDIRVIANPNNRGFPAAVNQGLEIANGQNLLLLNNDVIVTTGWLHRMLSLLVGNSEHGLVGPVSGEVSGPQRVAASYSSLEELDGFAWDWGQKHKDVIQEHERLVGFCLLFKREVMDRIGLLDERFGIGCFEDDDYCKRAIRAGYRCLISHETFIHHFGSRTFIGAGHDFASIMQRNRALYEQKWSNGNSEDSGFLETMPVKNEHPADESAPHTPDAVITRENVKLSACLIVRDNERTIRACLESLVPWMDEIIVVDTGSKDATPAIAQELGAKLHHWSWRDDFAAARNQSLQHAKGEWIFWMDSDDILPSACGQKLRELVLGSHEEDVMGYIMQVHCPSATNSSDITAVDHVKLIRNRPDLQFEFRIHEQIIPSIRKAGGNVAWTDLYVVHAGSDQTPEGQQKKLKRDFHLLDLELQDHPDHPFVLFNLGMTHSDTGNYEQAIEFLLRSISNSQPEESHLRKAYSLLVNCYLQRQDLPNAKRYCEKGLALFPSDKELLFRWGMLNHQLGKLQDAITAYQRVLDLNDERYFSSMDIGIGGYKARHNLALVYEELGKQDQAERTWNEILIQKPDYLPSWQSLGSIILSRHQADEIAAFRNRLASQGQFDLVALLFDARSLEQSGKHTEAIELLQQNDDQFADSREYLDELSRLQFLYAEPYEAIKSLSRLRELDPSNASVWHNLGLKLYETGSAQQAREALKESLRLRPNHADTIRHLRKFESDLVTSETISVQDLSNSTVHGTRDDSPQHTARKLSILYVADFQTPGKSEQAAATALKSLGHQVKTVHDASIPNSDALLSLLHSGKYDCFLAYKGCLGAKSDRDRLHPNGLALAEVLKISPCPGYVWYFDRVFEYDFDPTRADWMQNVAPYCRMVFLTDGALQRNSSFDNLYLLREGVSEEDVHPFHVPETEKRDLAFIGQIYGQRIWELQPLFERFGVDVISNCYGQSLNEMMARYRIIIGPQYPSIPHYWSNRIYLVLGHCGFFLAPELEGMSQEGFIPGTHYAPITGSAIESVEYWLSRPQERELIAQRGQKFVLENCTFKMRVQEMVDKILETL